MTAIPLANFHFQVDWGGTRMGFEEISNLSVEVDVIKYRDGLSPEYNVQKMPGMAKYSNITLKRGVFKGDNEFFDWWNTIQLNTVERRDITIKLLNESHEPVVLWKVKNAFPVKVEWTDLKSVSKEVAIESLEIAHEGMVIENK